MDAEKELIDRCLLNDPWAQEELYRKYAGKMFGICLRFSANTLEAQDILQEGFIRIFQHLRSFRFTGSFEGWLRKVMINTAITLHRRELKFIPHHSLEQDISDENLVPDIFARLTQKEILTMIQQLPPGYRSVFNLYVIDGYTHREIGKLLGISENTSKSQLSGARRSLRALLTKEGHDSGRGK